MTDLRVSILQERLATCEADTRRFSDLFEAASAARESEQRYQAFVVATSDVVYRMSPHWDEMCQLQGRDFPSDTEHPSTDWRIRYILPEDRASIDRAIDQAVGGARIFELEHRVRRADGTIGWTLSRAVPMLGNGEIVEWLGTARDITERKLSEQSVALNERFSRALMEGIPQLIWRAAERGRWTWASPQWTEFTGQAERDSHEYGWLSPLHPDDRAKALRDWDGAEEQGLFEADYRIFSIKERRYRWFQTRAAAVSDEDGSVIEWLGTSTDVDELRSLQEHQSVLVAELQHRTFNLMGVVSSMAEATLSSSTDLAEFGATYQDRLSSLARVQRLLSRSAGDQRVTFDELIQGELASVGASPSEDARVHLDGPANIVLRSSSVQTLAMALHELTTNAVKYGALSQPTAELSIFWKLERGAAGESWLRIAWCESDVDMVVQPRKEQRGTGQGRTLIEQALPYQLDAPTTYAMTEDGVRCSILIRVSDTLDGSRSYVA